MLFRSLQKSPGDQPSQAARHDGDGIDDGSQSDHTVCSCRRAGACQNVAVPEEQTIFYDTMKRRGLQERADTVPLQDQE